MRLCQQARINTETRQIIKCCGYRARFMVGPFAMCGRHVKFASKEWKREPVPLTLMEDVKG